MVQNRKIRKLTAQIRKLEKKIEKYEEKLERAKELMEQGRITKAQYQKAKMEYSERIRGLRGAIHRKEKARLYAERELKEKEKKK